MVFCISLILLAVLYRTSTPYLGGLSNFAPLMAITFCAAIYLPRKWAFLIPLVALLISDLILNHYYGVALFNGFMLAGFACYALAALMGLWVSGNKTPSTIVGACIASTLLFYLVTNTLAWATNPVYTKSLAGLFQALTVGDMIHQPQTWVFLRNSLVSDLLFTGLFVGCMEYTAARQGRRSLFRRQETVSAGA